MRVINDSILVIFVFGIKRRVDGATNSSLCFVVYRCNLDFLQSKNVRPFPAADVCAEGGLSRLRTRSRLRCGCRGEVLCNFRRRRMEERGDAVDIPGVDTERV